MHGRYERRFRPPGAGPDTARGRIPFGNHAARSETMSRANETIFGTRETFLKHTSA